MANPPEEIPMQSVATPMSGSIYAEIILRSQGRIDPVGLIENIVTDFLERTRGDAIIWGDEHANAVAREQADGGLLKYGPASRGYHWQNVFLPNGTQLKMSYKNRDHFAEIRHQQVFYEDASTSPSQFACRVADNTSRNAWRDIWVKRPDDKAWIFADRLRHEANSPPPTNPTNVVPITSA
jgi:hypothetical protein